MAHFAKLDENNIVIEVIVVNNDVLLKSDGTESEYKGKVFLNGLFGNATWVQTSYNNNFRKQYAGIGYKYDSTNDVFIKNQPFDSWTLDSNFDWVAPVEYPTDNRLYVWNESTLAWDLTKPQQLYTSWIWNEDEWEWQPPTPYPTDGQPYEWDDINDVWSLIVI